jgi:hypothetical protein
VVRYLFATTWLSTSIASRSEKPLALR